MKFILISISLFLSTIANATTIDLADKTINCDGPTDFKQRALTGGEPNFPNKPLEGITIVKENGKVTVKKDGKVFKNMENRSFKKTMRLGKDNDGIKFTIGSTYANIFYDKDDNGNERCSIRLFTQRYCPNIEYKFTPGTEGKTDTVYISKNNNIYKIDDDTGYATFYHMATYLKFKNEAPTTEEVAALQKALEKALKSISSLDIDTEKKTALNNELAGFNLDAAAIKNKLQNMDLKDLHKRLKKLGLKVKSNITSEFWKTTSEDTHENVTSSTGTKSCDKSSTIELNDKMDTDAVNTVFKNNMIKKQKTDDRRIERLDRRNNSQHGRQ